MRIAPFRPMPAVSWSIRASATDAIAAVALAGDEDGRAPAAVLGEPAAHELAERLEVALVPEVLLRVGRVVGLAAAVLAVALLLGLDHAAEAGSDGIDEHEVGESEPRRLVLDELGRHRRQRAVGREVDALRTDGAHVQVGRRRTRPAVEDERHGPRAVAVSGDVRDREDLRRGLLLLAQHRPLARRRVLDRLAPRPHVAVVSAPAGGSWSGFFSSFVRVFVSSLMGAHATRCSPQLSADNPG